MKNLKNILFPLMKMDWLLGGNEKELPEGEKKMKTELLNDTELQKLLEAHKTVTKEMIISYGSGNQQAALDLKSMLVLIKKIQKLATQKGVFLQKLSSTPGAQSAPAQSAPAQTAPAQPAPTSQTLVSQPPAPAQPAQFGGHRGRTFRRNFNQNRTFRR